MDNKILAFLLLIIKNNDDIQILVKYGLEYYQISEYINLSLQQKYVIMQDDKLVITQKGNELIKSTYNHNNEWIRPLYEKKVKRLGKYDIYIPLK